MDDLRTRITEEAGQMERRWAHDPRWAGVVRPYAAEQVIRLRGSFRQEHTLARRGAGRLWDLLHSEDHVAALGCLTGGQAVECVKAGLQAIYLSGWQVAADTDLAGHTYPDPVAVSGQLGARRGPQDQQCVATGGPDRVVDRRGRPRVAGADRRRRRGGVRRTPERLRADGLDDRSGCRGRALGGPARIREEVRSPGRQGARAHRAVRANAHRRSAGSRRVDRPYRAHRCALGHPAHLRRRRAGRSLPHRRANIRGILPRP
jgi:hypothetical protein